MAIDDRRLEALFDRKVKDWRELVVDFTLICIWCGERVESTDIVDVWAHIGTGKAICSGWRRVDGRPTETWAEPTMWKDGEVEF